eukprot:TRINITY_DN3987_c0_g1_i3.p1 TRINITY_DN3987_c0_g1~~TRINITY_DN3987_c0_g1_i3.p1  ORF type:complete len:213 (+),score=30.96 TRINITY_DN3987_c0_g1_i3:41-640(+)
MDQAVEAGDQPTVTASSSASAPLPPNTTMPPCPPLPCYAVTNFQNYDCPVEYPCLVVRHSTRHGDGEGGEALVDIVSLERQHVPGGYLTARPFDHSCDWVPHWGNPWWAPVLVPRECVPLSSLRVFASEAEAEEVVGAEAMSTLKEGSAAAMDPTLPHCITGDTEHHYGDGTQRRSSEVCRLIQLGCGGVDENEGENVC